MSPKIAISVQAIDLKPEAQKLAKQLQLPLVDLSTTSYPLLLVLTDKHLELQFRGKDKLNPIYVDFTSGKSAHRHQFGGGRGQLIARAVGIKKNRIPSVLDLTAGLGSDAFVLATLGCDLTMIERSPIITALLRDGLNRAQTYEWFAELKLHLIEAEAASYLETLTIKPDVIYLDPMFPDSKKSALVKKEMRILRLLIGDDLDAKEILKSALNHAARRVVVKRARLAPTLSDQPPDLIFEGKSSRYDVYLT